MMRNRKAPSLWRAALPCSDRVQHTLAGVFSAVGLPLLNRWLPIRSEAAPEGYGKQLSIGCLNGMRRIKPLQAEGIIVLIIRRSLIVLVVREIETASAPSAGRNDPRNDQIDWPA